MALRLLNRLNKLPSFSRGLADKRMPWSDDPHKGKIVSDSAVVADSLGESVGISRWDLLAREQGITDPFERGPFNRKVVSTKEDPNIVYGSHPEYRVSCCCEVGDVSLSITTLFQHETKRCECGHWFKLIVKDLPNYE